MPIIAVFAPRSASAVFCVPLLKSGVAPSTRRIIFCTNDFLSTCDLAFHLKSFLKLHVRPATSAAIDLPMCMARSLSGAVKECARCAFGNGAYQALSIEGTIVLSSDLSMLSMPHQFAREELSFGEAFASAQRGFPFHSRCAVARVEYVIRGKTFYSVPCPDCCAVPLNALH